MSRSVSVPSGFGYVEFVPLPDDVEDEFDFHDFILEPLKKAVKRAFPLMRPHEEFIGREDKALLANDFAYVGVSEYCGLLSVWIVERGDTEYPELAQHWICLVERKFRWAVREVFGTTYRKVATASNGESFYEEVRQEV